MNATNPLLVFAISFERPLQHFVRKVLITHSKAKKITYEIHTLRWIRSRTTDAQSLFSMKHRTFGHGQTNWADRFWGIWGIFDQSISTNVGTVSPLSMFLLINPQYVGQLRKLIIYTKSLVNATFGSGKKSC